MIAIMFRRMLLALLVVGLGLGCCFFSPLVAIATDSDPDNADGMDLHDNTVVEGLVMAVSDISSGNTIQVGPLGGIFEGGQSIASGAASAAAYSGACVLTGMAYTPMSGDAVDSGTTSEQSITGATVVTGVNFVPEADDDYLELYDGTSRGSYTTCKLDISGGTAGDGEYYTGPPINFASGVYAYTATAMPWRISYLNEDFVEVYDGTSRGNYTNCKIDIKGSAVNGTIPYRGTPIEFTTGIYVYNSNVNATWQVGYRIEDQSE